LETSLVGLRSLAFLGHGTLRFTKLRVHVASRATQHSLKAETDARLRTTLEAAPPPAASVPGSARQAVRQAAVLDLGTGTSNADKRTPLSRHCRRAPTADTAAARMCDAEQLDRLDPKGRDPIMFVP